MSANVCFITAVLAATAFTLASSCYIKPKSCKSEVVELPDYSDYFSIFCRFPPQICTTFFEQNIPTVLTAYNEYTACSDEKARLAFIELLNGYYSTSGSLEADIELIYEILNASGTPHELGCDDYPACKRVYTPYGIDLFDLYESSGSYELVHKFFLSKNYVELAEKHRKWKESVSNKSLKYNYLDCLYDLYRNQKPKILSDVKDFRLFEANWKSTYLKGLGLPMPIIPGCTDTYDIPSYEVVYTDCGKDLYIFFELCGSSAVVADFFKSKGHLDLVKKYLKWKCDVGNPLLKKLYREALYELYRPLSPDCLKKECIDFHNFEENWTPTSENCYPLFGTPDYETIISIYQNFPLDKLLPYLNKKNIVDLVQPLTTLKNCIDDDDALIAFIEALNKIYYGLSPLGNIGDDYKELLELIGAPTDSVTIVDGGYTVPKSIPTSSSCQVPFKIPTCPGDYLSLYDAIPLPQCIDFLMKNGQVDLLSAYIIYQNDNSPATKKALLQALSDYYGNLPNVSVDYETFIEFYNSWTPTSSGGNILPTIKPTCYQDYFDIYDSLTPAQCADFFIKKDLKGLLPAYFKYKIDGSPSTKEALLKALSDYYNKAACITLDYDELLEIINGGTPDVFSSGETVHIKECYTETTTITTTGDIGDICPQPKTPKPCVY